MPRTTTFRLAAVTAVFAVLAAVGADGFEARKLAPQPTSARKLAPQPTSARKLAPQPASDLVPAATTTYPTNAAKIFRWGNAQWFDDFIGPVKAMWSVNRPSLVRNQHGMLTINATATSGTVAAKLTGHGRRYGRWEARVRAQQYASSGTPYHVVWELVPTSGYRCGARSIVLADYALGTNTANMYVRNTPDVEYAYAKDGLTLGPGPFHTYAVEVTPDHVSWFVDTHVVMTERRPAALTGAAYAVRFRLVGTPGAQINPGRMQMDWVRYYSLERKNAQSIEAPQALEQTYAGAC